MHDLGIFHVTKTLIESQVFSKVKWCFLILKPVLIARPGDNTVSAMKRFTMRVFHNTFE